MRPDGVRCPSSARSDVPDVDSFRSLLPCRSRSPWTTRSAGSRSPSSVDISDTCRPGRVSFHHRVRYGGESCSQYIKRAIAEQGLWAGLKAMEPRFQACRAACRSLNGDRSLPEARSQGRDEYLTRWDRPRRSVKRPPNARPRERSGMELDVTSGLGSIGDCSFDGCSPLDGDAAGCDFGGADCAGGCDVPALDCGGCG